jgi:hypothetical protein
VLLQSDTDVAAQEEQLDARLAELLNIMRRNHAAGQEAQPAS